MGIAGQFRGDAPRANAYDRSVSPIKTLPVVTPVKRIPTPVKGPIRCHKCQLNCADAETYLSHKCEPRPTL